MSQMKEYQQLIEEKEEEIVESYLLEHCQDEYLSKDGMMDLLDRRTLDDVPTEYQIQWVKEFKEGKRGKK